MKLKNNFGIKFEFVNNKSKEFFFNKSINKKNYC